MVNTRKLLTIVFSDLRGFTEFSDKADPEDVIDLLNDYLSVMTALVFKYEGTLDKIMGDGMLVFFGDPIPMPDHAERAVKMAIAMKEKIKHLQEKWPLEEYQLNIGIGINTGYVTVGNIGSENRMDYTVIGKQVNLASRLQSEAKAGQILISKRTFEAVKEFIEAEEIQEITVKGLRSPISVYNVIGLKEGKALEGITAQ
jgi:class 3 adenylate cyclase